MAERKIEHQKLANTLLNTDHALLKQKQATQSGAEEYAQYPKSFRAAQNLCNEKDSVIFLVEEQIELLRDAIQTQGLDFPDATPRNAPAPAPSSQTIYGTPSIKTQGKRSSPRRCSRPTLWPRKH
jgi:hypothetical protein